MALFEFSSKLLQIFIAIQLVPYFLNAHLLVSSFIHRHPDATARASLCHGSFLNRCLLKSSSTYQPRLSKFRKSTSIYSNSEKIGEVEEVDVAIVGAGIGGLCAGSILNTLYNKKVGIYESHYLPGGCAHAFDRVATVPSSAEDKSNNDEKSKQIFTFDSGPTIVLGCSQPPYNPLRQILNAIGMDQEVNWIRYDGWGMIENHRSQSNIFKEWKVPLGPNLFETGPLTQFGGYEAVQEFQYLQNITKGLVTGAVEIPAMAGRSDKFTLLPLLRYFSSLLGLIQQGDTLTGTFAPFMDGPIYKVQNSWLRDWLDALAFSLSGLPANRTAASAMAYVLYDMHREGAALDYPQGGLGHVIDALVKGVEKGGTSKVNLKSHVKSIDTTEDGTKVTGLTLESGKVIKAKDGVICNAPIWSMRDLIKNEKCKEIMNDFLSPDPNPIPRQTWAPLSNINNQNDSNSKDASDSHSNQLSFQSKVVRSQQIISERQTSSSTTTTTSPSKSDVASLLSKCDTAEMTGSFLHLHLALNATDLNLDEMEAHYTVMTRGLSGSKEMDADGPCGELNMIAVSNPCVIDRTLAPDGYIVVHAYGAGNEPYNIWANLSRTSPEYLELKERRSSVLWEAVESIIPDVRDRVVLDLVGSPITHERFLRRPRGTYGAATEDYLRDGSTPIKGFVLCGDGIFPGIGIPAVAYSGASAANAMVNPWEHWKCMDKLKSKGLI